MLQKHRCNAYTIQKLRRGQEGNGKRHPKATMKRYCMGNRENRASLTIPLRSGHLAAQALREPRSPAAPGTATHAAPALSAPPALLRLLAAFVALRAVSTVAPPARGPKLLVKRLLVLLNHRVELVGESGGELLRARDLDAVEDDDASRLVERGGELLAPDHLGDNGGHRAQWEGEGAREQ